jgi:hypothetical protein
MGGPWRTRGFDPVAWRPPVAQIDARAETSAAHGSRDYLAGIVIGYVAAVVTSIAIVLTFLKQGW